MYMIFFFLNAWMPTYGSEVLHLDLRTAGLAASAVPFTGVLARPAGGWLAERFGSTRNIVLGGFFITGPVIGIITLTASPYLFGTLLVLAGFSTQVVVGAFYPYVTNVSSPESAGGSISLLAAASVLGSLTAPVLFGYVIEIFSWSLGFLTAAIFILGGIGITALTPDG